MPRTRYGVSPWIYNFPDSRRPDFSRARGDLTSDVVIVGGGLTGCLIAYACANAGVRGVLLEADRIGQGSTGRSAGLLLPDPGPPFAAVAKLYGLRTARRIYQSWRRASLDGAALMRRLGIKCRLRPHDALIVASRSEEKALRREYEIRNEAGLDVTGLSRKALQQSTALEVAAAMKMRDAFSLDPYRACLGVALAAAKRGATLHERSHVRKVKFTRKDAQVIGDGLTIRTRRVVVTTGSATPEFRQLRRHFKRRETYLVLTEPMPGAVRRTVGRRDATIGDMRVPRHRILWTDDNRILVTGADQPETPARKRDAVLVQRTGQLMYELLTMYPAISGMMPEFGWELSYGETADGLPYIGPHRNYPHHLFALGLGSDSITGAFVAARILMRAIQGSPEKGDDVFNFLR
jgi:glycine/D-amino acid oxidase-like deaminating enzyme